MFEFRDLFHFFRFLLAVVLTIYFTIVTAQFAWSWWVWLRGSDRYITMLRRYLIVQGLRLKFRAFWGDVILCLLLTVAFALLWRAQSIMDRTHEMMTKATHVEPRS